MSESVTLTPSTGNVFADLGFEKPKALEAKALLAHAVTSAIKQRKLTQAQAAALFGIKQPDVSKLMSGRLMGVSLERLLAFLVILKHDVSITVKPHRGAGQPKVLVTTGRPRRRTSRRPIAA
jgi:predicted XRE-type DNA-binding protein